MLFQSTTILISSLYGQIPVRSLSGSLSNDNLFEPCIDIDLFADGNDFSWETIQNNRNLYYQKQMVRSRHADFRLSILCEHRQTWSLLKSPKLFHRSLLRSISNWTLAKVWRWTRRLYLSHWKRHRLHLYRVNSCNKLAILKFDFHQSSIRRSITLHQCHFEWVFFSSSS